MIRWFGMYDEHHEKTPRQEYSTRDDMLLKIMEHYRHNWLNDLQLLFGYIKLKKYDRLEAFVGKIKEKLEAERALSRITMPAVAIDIMFFQQCFHKFQLAVDMASDHPLYHSQGFAEKLRQSMLDILFLYEHIASESSELTNKLSVFLHCYKDYALLKFEYVGRYSKEDYERAKERLVKAQHERNNTLQCTEHVEQLNIEVVLEKPIQ